MHDAHVVGSCPDHMSFSPQLTADQVMNFFTPCGEIKYVRMAGDETQPTRWSLDDDSNCH